MPRARLVLLNAGPSTYDQEILRTNPIAYWPQSEETGLTAH